jgi:predicted ATPase
MTNACACSATHTGRRIVITGGPGAGKTAILELARRMLCSHVVVLPEAAGIVFGGGFPRKPGAAAARASQRAIFAIQRELEAIGDTEDAATVLCDRGVVDGVAYWPGPEEFWEAVGLAREDAFTRYEVVIHLRVPEGHDGYQRRNPLRIESAAEARAIDDRIFRAWEGHPRRHVIDAESDFVTKANRALDLIRHALPACCRAPLATPRHDSPLGAHHALAIHH